MEEKFLRLIAGQQFLIEPHWGYNKLVEISAMSELVAADAEFFKQMREQSQEVHFFQDGNYLNPSSEIVDGSVARVSLSGVMTVEDGWCHYGIKTFDRTMRSLYADDRVRGIIVDVDSGGGQAAAGNLMFNTISDRNKPVIDHFTFKASAAVLGTLTTDESIAASDMSMSGSIGVMMNIPKYYMDAEDERNDSVEFYSKKSPRKNEVWRALERGDTSLLINWLTELDELFMAKVRKHRPLKGGPNYQAETLSGAMFNARQAKRRGLIDSVGSFNYALKRMNSAIKYWNT